jgi:hypothetical protein
MSLSDIFCVNRHKEDFYNLLKNDLDILIGNENEINELVSIIKTALMPIDQNNGEKALEILKRISSVCGIELKHQPNSKTLNSSQKFLMSDFRK